MNASSVAPALKVELIAVTSDAERVIEQAGRTCYLSFDRIGASSQTDFIKRLIKMGHVSPLEHAYATFRIQNGSRAMTHQLVRHRLMAISQQSQRYVGEEHFRTVEPPSVQDNPDAHALFEECMTFTRNAYRQLQEMGIRNEDARFILPNAVESEIVVTADLREWRHIICLRGVAKAQWEIRRIAAEIFRILRECVPSVFADMGFDEKGNLVLKK